MWQLEQFRVGTAIPWCFHKEGTGKIKGVMYSHIYATYRVTCTCDKAYSVSLTGRYTEGK